MNLGDFALAAVSPTRVLSGAGGRLDVTVEAIRAEDYTDPIDLSVVTDAPLDADLSDQKLSGVDDVHSTLHLTVPAGTPTGTYRATVTGTSDRTHTVRVSVRVDADRPSASAPAVGVRAGTRFDTSSFLGARHLERGDGPDLVDPWLPGAVERGRRRLGIARRPRQLGALARAPDPRRPRVRRAAPRPRLRRQLERLARHRPDADVRRPGRLVDDRHGGRWRLARSSTASGHTTHFAKARGASIRRTFTGRAVAIVAPRGPHRGAAQVWVDGVHVRTIHLHASSLHARRVVFARSWHGSAAHTIRLVVLGTAHHPRVDLDAIVILR